MIYYRFEELGNIEKLEGWGVFFILSMTHIVDNNNILSIINACVSQADSLDELKANLTEALDGYLNEPVGSSIIFPNPDKSISESSEILGVEVSPNIAFALQLRKIRIERKMTQTQMQELLGFKNRTSYSRLEKTNCNPSLGTIQKVFSALPNFPIADIFTNNSTIA